MAKHLSLSWAVGVEDHESALALQTIHRILNTLYLRHPPLLDDPPIRVRAYGNWVIPALVPDKPYWGTQWYIDSSYNDKLARVIAPAFLELVRQEPWQRIAPHLDIAILDQDLTDFPAPLARLRPDRFTLGTSLPGSSAVLSVRRVRTLTDPGVRDLALSRLVAHHLGHVLGVPQYTRESHASRLGLEYHCTNVCTMRHASSVKQLAKYAIEESEMGWGFCPECTVELHSAMIRLWRNWN